MTNFKKNTEGELTSKDQETLTYRVYSDGAVKIEGFNTLEFFNNAESAQAYCKAYGLTEIK